MEVNFKIQKADKTGFELIIDRIRMMCGEIVRMKSCGQYQIVTCLLGKKDNDNHLKTLVIKEVN